MSVRTKDSNEANAIEALRRAKFKFPGRQKVLRSNKWGFSKYSREEYLERRANGTLVADGNSAKYIAARGPLVVPRR